MWKCGCFSLFILRHFKINGMRKLVGGILISSTQCILLSYLLLLLLLLLFLLFHRPLSSKRTNVDPQHSRSPRLSLAHSHKRKCTYFHGGGKVRRWKLDWEKKKKKKREKKMFTGENEKMMMMMVVVVVAKKSGMSCGWLYWENESKAALVGQRHNSTYTCIYTHVLSKFSSVHFTLSKSLKYT